MVNSCWWMIVVSKEVVDRDGIKQVSAQILAPPLKSWWDLRPILQILCTSVSSFKKKKKEQTMRIKIVSTYKSLEDEMT